LWLGAWLWLCGGFDRASDWSRHELYTLSANAGFSVQDVDIEGRENADLGTLRAVVNIGRGDSIFEFDPKEARDMMQRVSWVKEARVERRLPHTIHIEIVERKPLALWQNKKKLRLIDSEGVTLADSGLDKFQDLPIVVGEDAPAHAAEILTLLAAEPVVQARTEAVSRIGARRWDLTLKNGLTVRLPENDPGFALSRLAKAQEEDRLLDKDLKVIDLREPDRIIVRTASGTPEEYKSASGVKTGGADRQKNI
jgi:cell division protein FtsQ